MPLFTSTLSSHSPTTAAAGIESQLHVRILIETAMEQAKFTDTDSELIARQLAGELTKIAAPLSDVRIAVHELYAGDRTAAEAYLSYLASHGFPQPSPAATAATATASATTHQQVIPTRDIETQNQAISQHSSQSYGQLSAVEGDAVSLGIAFYSGNLIAELVANSAYSALVFGERRSGTSAILRAIVYDQIAKSGDTLLDILDCHNGEWGGLEHVQLNDGSRLVSYRTVSCYEEIEAVTKKLSVVANEVKRRQRQQRTQALSLSAGEVPSPYLFLIDGLSEIHGALPGWGADRRSKDPLLSRSASSLRFILGHGPAVGISCVATARDHSSCLCDPTALGETKLLFLGRASAGRNGGYRAIDKAIEDKALLPSPHERSRYRETLSVIKQQRYSVVFTPNGVPRLGALGDFGGYLAQDLLTHYQQSLEVSAG